MYVKLQWFPKTGYHYGTIDRCLYECRRHHCNFYLCRSEGSLYAEAVLLPSNWLSETSTWISLQCAFRTIVSSYYPLTTTMRVKNGQMDGILANVWAIDYNCPFCFLDRAFSIMKTKNKPMKCTNQFWIIYYWSITPTCFGPSVEAIIREYEILESYKAIVLV